MLDENLLIKTSSLNTLGNMFNLTSKFDIIAGPCSIESIEQMEIVAERLKNNRLHFIRGGAFKPRTSPYDFQGLGIQGFKILRDICKKYSLYSISEIVDVRDIELGMQYIDIIQIGSRNMTNFSLLKEIGKTNHPVLLKRGMMATLKEFLLATEYILQGGNKNIILCERGIRTFENSTRNTLDLSSVAIVFIDAVHFSVRDNSIIKKLAAYIIMGISEEGKKEVLSIHIGENESSKYWLGVLNELKNRGVSDILVLCANGLTGIKESIAVAFPQTEYQRCIVHQVRNTRIRTRSNSRLI